MKNDFTPAELRAKDAWIAEHVMGWKLVKSESEDSPLVAAFSDANKYFENWKTEAGYITLPKFTTDPAASDALDDKIMEWCKENNCQVETYKDQFGFGMRFRSFNRLGRDEDFTEHLDKKICRVLFAEKLFKKQTSC